MSTRARVLIGLSLVMLAGCASSDPDFYFRTWVGRAPATPQEEGDGRVCFDQSIAKVPAAFRGGVVAAGATTDYKSCLRARGYTLDTFELNDKGEWVKR
jgi:hypothetical protein